MGTDTTSENPEASPFNFHDMLTNFSTESSSQNAQYSAIYTSGSILSLINAYDVLADVVPTSRWTVQETSSTVKIHHNNIDNPLVLISSKKEGIISDIIEVIMLDSLDSLTET